MFFRLVVRRYERASMVITSNKGFLDWGEVFPGLVRQDRQRPGAGHGHPGSPATLLDHAQHQGGERPAQGEASGRTARRSRRATHRREGGGSPALTIGRGHLVPMIWGHSQVMLTPRPEHGIFDSSGALGGWAVAFILDRAGAQVNPTIQR